MSVETKAPTVEELWQVVCEQRERIAALEARLDRGNAPPPAERRSRKQDRRLSRAGLLKAGTIGMAGLAGAELVGSLAARPALALTSNTNFEAYGGSGIAFYQPGDSTGYSYSTGV